MEEIPSIPIPPKLMDSTDLGQQAEELKFLCDHFDPFAPSPSPDIRSLLHKYVSEEERNDPFKITNKLILLLENTLEELQRREEKT